ncbi:MAG: helix-turn-helix domain-containing protein [Parvibaculum sp.]
MAAISRPEKKRAGRWGDREASILDAAWMLIRERGFDRITMAEIAASIGLSEGSLYNYVPSKRELAIRVSERWFAGQTATLSQTLDTFSSTQEKITLIVERHIAMILDQPELFLMWIREVRATDAYQASSSRDIFRAYTGLLRTTLKNARKRDEIRHEMSDDMMRDMIYGGAEHIAWTSIVQKREKNFDTRAAAKTLSSTYWRALKTDSETTPQTGLEDRLSRIEEKLDQLT